LLQKSTEINVVPSPGGRGVPSDQLCTYDTEA